jgi:hypothetical protein
MHDLSEEAGFDFACDASLVNALALLRRSVPNSAASPIIRGSGRLYRVPSPAMNLPLTLAILLLESVFVAL